MGDGEGHGNLVCRSPWGHKESDTTERLNNNKSGKNGSNRNKHEAPHLPVEASVHYRMAWQRRSRYMNLTPSDLVKRGLDVLVTSR